MDIGTIVWTKGIIVNPNSALDSPQFLGPLTKGRYDGEDENGNAIIWFGDKIGYIHLLYNKITTDNGRR